MSEKLSERWVYINYDLRRQIVAEIDASGILAADEILTRMIREQPSKRNNIGAYKRDMFPKQYMEDFYHGFCCSH